MCFYTVAKQSIEHAILSMSFVSEGTLHKVGYTIRALAGLSIKRYRANIAIDELDSRVHSTIEMSHTLQELFRELTQRLARPQKNENDLVPELAIESLLLWRPYNPRAIQESFTTTLIGWLRRDPDNVRQLSLHHCGLLALPRGLRFTRLEHVDLSFNELHTVPDWIFDLQSLRLLNLNGNQLKQLWRHEPKCLNLEVLHIGGNRLTHLPISIRLLSKLRELYLLGNDFTAVLQEPELIDSFQPTQRLVEARDTAGAIVAYANEWYLGRTRLARFKIALVGDGRVGKTTLKERLIHSHQGSTDDVQRTRSIQWHAWQPEGVSSWQYDVWDFPGQAEHYATHNLFLSDWQCVFVIVCDLSSDNWKARLNYWSSFLQCKSSFVLDHYHHAHLSDEFHSVSRSGSSEEVGLSQEADDKRVTFSVNVVGTHIDRLPDERARLRARQRLEAEVDRLQHANRHIRYKYGGEYNLTKALPMNSTIFTLLLQEGDELYRSLRSLVPSSYKLVYEWTQRQRALALDDVCIRESQQSPARDQSGIVTTLGRLIKDLGGQISKSRLEWILKQLHSFGELVFLPRPKSDAKLSGTRSDGETFCDDLSSAPGSSVDEYPNDELDDDEPVILSLNWLLAKIGNLFDPDNISDRERQQHNGRYSLEDLSEYWLLSNRSGQVDLVAKMLERFFLCCRLPLQRPHDRLRFAFPLLLAPLQADERRQLMEGLVLGRCRWFRASPASKQALPPGAFGMFQVYWHDLSWRANHWLGSTDSQWIGTDVMLQLNEALILVNGRPVIVISFHNPALEVSDSSDQPADDGSSDSMICICQVYDPTEQGDNGQGSENDDKLWQAVVESVRDACTKCSSQSSPLLEVEIPCIECVRASWLISDRYSVCRAFSLDHCPPRSKYYCRPTRKTVTPQVLLSSEEQARIKRQPSVPLMPIKPGGTNARAPEAPSPSTPAPLAPGAHGVRMASTPTADVVPLKAIRWHCENPVRLGNNETECRLWQLASELDIDSAGRRRLRARYQYFVESFSTTLAPELEKLKAKFPLGGLQFKLDSLVQSMSQGSVTLFLILNSQTPVYWNQSKQVVSWAADGDAIPSEYLSELFKCCMRTLHAMCAAAQELVQCDPQAQDSNSESFGALLSLPPMPVLRVDFLPVLKSTWPLLNLYSNGSVRSNDWARAERTMKTARADLPGFSEVIMAGKALIDFERHRHGTNVHASIFDSMALQEVDAIQTDSWAEQESISSMLRRCFARMARVAASPYHSLEEASFAGDRSEVTKALAFPLQSILANESDPIAHAQLLEWLHSLGSASAEELLARLEAITQPCEKCNDRVSHA